AVLRVTAAANADEVAVRQRAGIGEGWIRVEDVDRWISRASASASQLWRSAEKPRPGGGIVPTVVQVERRAGGAIRLDARDIDPLAAISKKTFNGVRQIQRRITPVGIEQRIEALPEPAHVLTIAGHQNRHVDRATFGHPHHPGSAGADPLDRLTTGVN